MVPTLENGGRQIFEDIYSVVDPLVTAVNQGDYSALPPKFVGPEAWDSFRAKERGDPINQVIGPSYFYQGRHQRFGHSYGTWPWPGMKTQKEAHSLWPYE